jgi:hypothetical protein
MLAVLVPEEPIFRVNCDYYRRGIGWWMFGRASKTGRKGV